MNLRDTASLIKKYWRQGYGKQVFKKNLIQDIKALRKEFKEVQVTKASISVVTGPIKIKGRNFGRFKLQWEYGWDIYAIALEPYISPWNNFYNKTGLEVRPRTHPHVSRNSVICMGAGHRVFEKAKREGDLLGIFLAADGVLKGYTGYGAYARINHWNKNTKCIRCGEVKAVSRDIYKCVNCSITACKDCMTFVCKDENCRMGYCSSCANWHKLTTRKDRKKVLCTIHRKQMKRVVKGEKPVKRRKKNGGIKE